MRLRLSFARFLVSLLVLLALASPSWATRPVRRTGRPGSVRGFNLFAGAVNVVMNVNRVQCNIDNTGQSCVDPTGSPSLGGGFWPKGSPDQYIFNSGLQVAALIPGTKTASFNWPGDTVGAFFFDPRGDQSHGEGRTNVMNALNAADLAAWPTAANINDTTLFNSALIGRQTVSQQDTWVRFWDGNPNLSNGRQHPMGILVEQRGLAWNFPSGNQDIVYFLYRFINITASDPARYAGLAQYGYSPSDIAEIVTIAQEFQQRSEAAFNVQIPDSGFTWTNMYAAFAQDPDIGSAGSNFSNANLIFNIAMAYKADFKEPTWQFPSAIFSAPFAPAPGFEGVKYLKSPQNIGIAMSGNTTNGAPFPDAVGVQRLWRNLSGNLLPSDGSCSFPGQQVTLRYCQWVQTAADTRFYESSGPFTMNAGESAVIVVAYIHAAPVAAQPASAPASPMKAIPAFQLAPFIGATGAGLMNPGFAIAGNRLAAGADTLRNVDRAAGWVTQADLDGDGVIEQCSSPSPAPCVTEVTTTPRSLYNKGLVAQAVFDNKFLLPFAPEVPPFFLVPGDNQVTVAWQKSSTETVGDPFFVIASSPVSPLYDPNFRKFDVEGYRIWRGRTQSEMEVIASFDYAGTSMNDLTGAFTSTDYGASCAPELGITSSCPTFPHAVPLVGDVVQVPPGGRVELSPVPPATRGLVLVTVADTAVTGGASNMPALVDNGVPFAYIDHGVLNGFRYFYSVTAFDINSIKSGPSSLESPLVTKSVIPRVPSTNAVPATVILGQFRGDGTTQLQPHTVYPAIDPNDGTFAGPLPPANGGTFEFLASVAEALPPGDYGFRVDSVSPGFVPTFGTTPNLYGTFFTTDSSFAQTVSLPMPTFSASTTTAGTFTLAKALVPYDTARARLIGITNAFASTGRMPVQFTGHVGPIANAAPSVSLAFGRYAATGTNAGAQFFAHSYWFTDGAAQPADPTIDPFGSAAHTNGALTGITTIYEPLAYRVPITGGAAAHAIDPAFRGVNAAMGAVWYPADITVTWGAAGAVTVRDSTHGVDLPYKQGLQPGYGFLDLAAMNTAGVTAASLNDVGFSATMAALNFAHLYTTQPACGGNVKAVACVPLRNTAVSTPIDINGDGTAEGNGFAFVVNGEPFFMIGAIPAAGTIWHLKATGGATLTATCTPAIPATFYAFGAQPTDCSNYSYTPPPLRNPYAPGMSYKIRVTQAFAIAAAAGDISHVHTVPDPYYVTNSLEITANTKVLRFVNLPDRAIVRIYSSSGILVSILTHNSLGGGGEEVWNLRNRNNQFVASGVYFYHVEAPDGQTKVGRFTVVNYAQ